MTTFYYFALKLFIKGKKRKKINNDLEIAHPRICSSVFHSWLNWNLTENLNILVFEERGKTQYLQENLSERTYNELNPHICNCHINKSRIR